MSRIVSMWRSDKDLLLASKSQARLDLLNRVGIPARPYAAEIDERAIEADWLSTHAKKTVKNEDLALTLSKEKALFVSARFPDAWVIGADQILTLNDRILHKCKTRDEAIDHLLALAGQRHQLCSAVTIATQGQIQTAFFETATLDMRALTKAQIDIYCDCAGDILFSSVGAYAWEGLGRHLFDTAQGTDDVILGLPLIPLIRFFRSVSCLAF